MIAIIKLLEEWAAPFYTKNVSLLPHAHVCNDRKWCSLALENEAILSCKATQVSVGCWWQRRIQRDLKSLKTFGHFLFFSKEFVRGRFLSSTFFYGKRNAWQISCATSSSFFCHSFLATTSVGVDQWNQIFLSPNSWMERRRKRKLRRY